MGWLGGVWPELYTSGWDRAGDGAQGLHLVHQLRAQPPNCRTTRWEDSQSFAESHTLRAGQTAAEGKHSGRTPRPGKGLDAFPFPNLCSSPCDVPRCPSSVMATRGPFLDPCLQCRWPSFQIAMVTGRASVFPDIALTVPSAILLVVSCFELYGCRCTRSPVLPHSMLVNACPGG